MGLIYAANISDVICRDYDRLEANGELHVWPFLCNIGRPDASRTILLSNDWGGVQVKSSRFIL